MQLHSPQTEALRLAVRDWALTRVRPLAREADLEHCTPKGGLQVIDDCPVRFGRVKNDPRAAEAIKADGAGVLEALIMEDVAFGDVWPLFAEHSGGIGHNVVQAMGTPAQRERWAAPVRRGDATSAFALTEPHFGSDPSQVATTARREGDEWVINGHKMYCTGGASASYVVVFATIDKEAGRHGIRAFVVEKGTPGASVTKPNENKLGIRSSETSELAYENCRVPLDHCLGLDASGLAAAKSNDGNVRSQSGFTGALGAMTESRPLLGGTSIGIARAARQVAWDWAVERRSEFSPARWTRLEEEFDRMQSALDHASRMVVRAMWQKDRQIPIRRSGSAAKAFAPPIAERVIRRCLQWMGPDGLSQDYLVEKWYRDVKIFDIFEGSGQIHRITIARDLMGPGAARG
jgi:acyl-CoA dehydrogenase